MLRSQHGWLVRHRCDRAAVGVGVGATLEAANTLTGRRKGGLDPHALLPLFRDDQIIHMLPSLDFEAEKAFRKGTQAAEVIDYFAANFGSKAKSSDRAGRRLADTAPADGAAPDANPLE